MLSRKYCGKPLYPALSGDSKQSVMVSCHLERSRETNHDMVSPFDSAQGDIITTQGDIITTQGDIITAQDDSIPFRSCLLPPQKRPLVPYLRQ
jgi:hypothetical protein